jgi:hypothetical protein
MCSGGPCAALLGVTITGAHKGSAFILHDADAITRAALLGVSPVAGLGREPTTVVAIGGRA